MRNIIILCTILLIAIITLAAKYFTALSGSDNNVTKVLNYIPADAALILTFKNDESFYEIFKDYELFNAIIGDKHEEEIKSIREVLLKPVSLTEATADKNVFLTLHSLADSTEFLYSITLDKEHSAEDITEAISEIPNMTVKALSQDFYRLENNAFKRPLYAFIQPGLTLASFSKALIAKSVHEKTQRLSASFIEEINKTSSRNHNSPINLFINHRAVSPFLLNFITVKRNGNSSLLTDLQGYSSLSMNYKSDALMFNGISNVDSLSPNYLNLFLHQQAVPNTIKKILPENTSNFIAFGLSDVPMFHTDLKKYFEAKGQLKALEEELKNLQVSSGINANRDILPLIDKEFVVVENSYGEKFALIKVTNGRDLNFKLKLISTSINDLISQIDYNNFFYYYLGEPLKEFPRPYFAVIDNYLMLSNTPYIIRNYLTAYESENFLSNTDAFKDYDQLVANKSNILYFVNNKKSDKIIESSFKPKYFEALKSKRLKNFYGLSYQWTADGDHFFTNLYLSYNSSDSLTLNNK